MLKLYRATACAILFYAVLWQATDVAMAGESTCNVATVTAYSIEMFPGLTATGQSTIGNAGYIAAVDPRVIPLGSYVYVHNYPTVMRASDTGSAVRGWHVDMLVQTTREALGWGKQVRTVCWWWP